MANSRPPSLIMSSNGSDEANINASKSVSQKIDSSSTRSSNQQKLPVNNIVNAHSSSSSLDSAGAKNSTFVENKSLPQINSNATVSSTTTDSELESEQDERYIDDNNMLDLNNVPLQLQQQQQKQQQQQLQHQPLSRRDSGQQKSDTSNPEQVSRRVKHFQKLFKSEIDDMPELIDSYVCAYQGDILLQGKMYITDRYLCFHSRIISYVTKHVYRWEQIDNVTKERVAFIFPTAIGIQLKPSGKKVIYASFLQRDQAFDKIIYMCSRFSNDSNSLPDDDDNSRAQNGTLKATNSNHGFNEKTKKSKRDIPYNMADEPEQEDVLQLCLGTNPATVNNNKRRPLSGSSKNSDMKQQSKQSKKLFNSEKNKSFKTSNTNQNLPKNSMENNSDMSESIKNSCHNNQEKELLSISSDTGIVLRQHHGNPIRASRSCSRDRLISSTNHMLSNNSDSSSSLPSMKTTDLSLINSNNDGPLGKYSRIIILSVISIIKIIMEFVLLFLNRFKTYSIKTSLILLIFIAILIIHSFYLIKLAYRIENRLQSLHHMWPSVSSIKNIQRT